MIALRLVGGEPYVDPRFLDSTDVPFILLAIICLFIAYYKIKSKKPEKNTEEITNEVEDSFELKSYDILMQPKKNNDNDTLPLINFSLPKVSLKELILGILIMVFYYLIFTGKI